MPDARADASDSWVVPLRASGTERPLFCACPGGGDGFEYRDLAAALSPDLPVYGFGLPPLKSGRQFVTVEHLAAVYIHKVRQLQEHGPFRLCGHSFGGLVVFEMARLLVNNGQKVELVALLDTVHPACVLNLSLKGRAKFQLSYISDRLARYGQHLRHGRIDKMFSRAFIFVKAAVSKRFWKIAGLVLGGLGFPIPKILRGGEVATLLAWHAHTPSTYQGKVVLFSASDRGPEFGVDPTLGWRVSAIGGLEIHMVPGDHLSMMRPPHVQALAKQLSSYLAPSAVR
jgi:thioesterase domain-containing protein